MLPMLPLQLHLERVRIASWVLDCHRDLLVSATGEANAPGRLGKLNPSLVSEAHSDVSRARRANVRDEEHELDEYGVAPWDLDDPVGQVLSARLALLGPPVRALSPRFCALGPLVCASREPQRTTGDQQRQPCDHCRNDSHGI